MMNYFDAHAHYSDPKFSELGGAIQAAKDAFAVGVSHIMLNSTGAADTAANLTLAKELSVSGIVFNVAAGIHPETISEDGFDADAELSVISSALKSPKAKAVGEIGLDYYWDKREMILQAQKELFSRQLAIAAEHNLPAVIHDRDAHGDVVDILRAHRGVTAILHSFSGSVETAREILSLGHFISLSGVVTFKNARVSVEVARYTPLERLLIETDAPYLAPHPYRGKCNTSAYLPLIAEKIAEIKGISSEEVAAATTANAKAVYKI